MYTKSTRTLHIYLTVPTANIVYENITYDL